MIEVLKCLYTLITRPSPPTTSNPPSTAVIFLPNKKEHVRLASVLSQVKQDSKLEGEWYG